MPDAQTWLRNDEGIAFNAAAATAATTKTTTTAAAIVQSIGVMDCVTSRAASAL